MNPVGASVRRSLQAIKDALPEGRLAAPEVWGRRHRVIVRIAVLQAVALMVLSAAWGFPAGGTAISGATVAFPLMFAVPGRLNRRVRSSAATVSLFLASMVLVYLCHGLTEAHFHFFVMVAVVALYQDWVPFGIGVGIVVLHNGLLGTLDPKVVYGDTHAQHDPWLWAGVHGGFILAASLAHLASWRLAETQGRRDPLTGLANRAQLGASLRRALERPTSTVSVLFIDLDDFKELNDAAGHDTGDAMLRLAAERLGACVGAGDLIARLGGDEFAVLVAGDQDVAAGIARHALVALAEPAFLGGRQVGVHASIGIATTADTPEHSDEALLHHADLAMYLAKAGGKNRIVTYSAGMELAARGKAELAEDLRHALSEGQFEVYYQPTIALADGRAIGCEALLRWRHPARGLVSPADFVPLAEDNGHIVAIGAWVLRTALAQTAAWTATSGRPIEIAVNLSPRQVVTDDIVDVVREALAASGLPARQLVLEITEGVLVADVDVVSARLNRLRALGVRIALDDFGTGFSSLSYLRRLPVDTIKIDQSFVRDLGPGGSGSTLVSTIIDLARSLDLDVVAEGVETQAQADVLIALRCRLVQGYLYARPAPAAQVSFPPDLPGPRGESPLTPLEVAPS